jgi:hypothetical protein
MKNTLACCLCKRKTPIIKKGEKTMKKTFATILLISMLMCMTACTASSSTTPGMTSATSGGSNKVENPTAPEIPSGNSTVITEAMLRSMPENPASDFTYANSRKVSGGLRIDSYTGSSDIVVIPEEIDGKPVVEIAVYTFANDSIVRGVVIPKTVKSVKELFVNNKNIEIVIAEGLESVGEFTFGNCPNLRKVVLGDNLKTILGYAFYVCTGIESIYIPASMTEMLETDKETAFLGCEKITIYGETGSYIEEICKQQSIPFVCE